MVILCFCVQIGHCQNWTLTSAPVKNWSAVASSADGSKLFATINNGGIYTSTNAGVNWFTNNAPVRNWYAIAVSSDGSNLVAADYNSANHGIYTSTNMGGTWFYRTNLSSIQSVASSANGMYLLAAAWGPGNAYTSTNYGVTWQKSSLVAGYWTSSASSADGSKLIVGYGGYVEVSTNYGTNWTQGQSIFSSATAVAVACSGDGNTMVWATGGGFQGGGIFTTTNYGVSWRTNIVANSGLSSAAISADGSRIAVMDNGLNFFSSDGGQSWVSNTVAFVNFKYVAASADGTRLVAAVPNGNIYVTQPPMLSLKLTNGIALVSWPSKDVSWNLRCATNLPSTNWLTPAEALQDDGNNKSILVSVTNDTCFYRLSNP